MERENLVRDVYVGVGERKSWGRVISVALSGVILVLVAVILLTGLKDQEKKNPVPFVVQESSVVVSALSRLDTPSGAHALVKELGERISLSMPMQGSSFSGPNSEEMRENASINKESPKDTRKQATQPPGVMNTHMFDATAHQNQLPHMEKNAKILSEYLDTLREDGFHTSRPTHIWDWSVFDFLAEFVRFVIKHAKHYETLKERMHRFQIFRHNVHFIHTHNESGQSYRVRMNKFGDLTSTEFSNVYLGYAGKDKYYKNRSMGVDVSLLSYVNDAVHVDWRDRGCVSPVKDQAQCGSCWAFSATGALEGNYCAVTGRHVNLSEQQLVDCSTYKGNEGCGGGLADSGFEYVIDNGGLCAEDAYPYKAVQGKCMDTQCKNLIQLKGFKDVPSENQAALKAAVAQHGPVAVALEADKPGFQFYGGGVLSGACGTTLDHAVLVVGYGVDEETGLPYWLVKNSWGKGWGVEGFIKISQGHMPKGECGILLDPSYPIFEV